MGEVDFPISLGVMDYDIQRIKAECLAHNSSVKIFEISAKTGEDFDEWF